MILLDTQQKVTAVVVKTIGEALVAEIMALSRTLAAVKLVAVEVVVVVIVVEVAEQAGARMLPTLPSSIDCLLVATTF